MNVLSVRKFAPIDERHELNLYRGNVMQISFDARSGYSLPRWMQVVTAVAALTVAQVAAAAVDISGTPATTAIVGSTYSFTPNVTGASYYRFYISNKPAWASFDSHSGRLSGKPATTNVGTTSGIRITARGNRSYDSLPSFAITVANSTSTPTNTAPTISGTPATTVVAGAAYSFTPKASDANGDTVSFSITNKPTWATFSIATGALTGTPAAANVGTTSGIVISASDGKASTALTAFNLAVTAASGGTTNHAPTITGSPGTSVTAGNAYSFTPSAADADGNKLTFAITNKPSWATFSTTTGALTGTPTASNVGATAGIGISVSDGTATTSLSSFTLTVDPAASAPVTTGSPRVLFLDQVAGPVTGGENNNGTYVSIFGKNFGSDLSKVRVYFGNAEVAAYRAIGTSKGRTDIQQIVVQPGAGVGSGTLPVKVVVNGVTSNADVNFQVNPGDIIFVSQSGNDSTAAKNDPNKPYRHLQLTDELTAAVGAAKPGDVIVLRGGTWSDTAVDGAFVRFWKTGGTAPTGSKGTGYMTVTGYPGETVKINAPKGGGVQGGGSEAQQAKYIVLSNLTIVGNSSPDSDGAPINSQVKGNYWRVVNNDVSWANVSGTMLAGGVVGVFGNSKILGNAIHDIAGGYMNHGVYLDSGSSNTELAFNNIHHVTEGNLVQTFDSVGGGPITSLDIHHNSIHDGGRYGLNLSEGTRGVHAWNNVIYNTVYSGIRLSVDEPSLSYVIEHNTLYNVCSNHPQEPGAIYNGWNAGTGTVAVRYNIFLKGSGGCSAAYTGDGGADGAFKFTRNLYSGYSATSKDATALSSNPMVTNAAGGDFTLQSSSPAIDAASGSTVTDDFSEKARSLPDIGALEK